MIKVSCQVSHDPEKGTYGDCLRACIATMLEKPSNDVPHFYHDGCDGNEGNKRLQEYLKTQNLIACYQYFESAPVDEVKQHMKVLNPEVVYLLMGSTATGDHIVICKNDEVLHNPNWGGQPIIKPTSLGVTVVMVLVSSLF